MFYLLAVCLAMGAGTMYFESDFRQRRVMFKRLLKESKLRERRRARKPIMRWRFVKTGWSR